MQLLKLAPQELPSRELSAFADLICNLETEAFDRIQDDVSWFIKKFDYRFQAGAVEGQPRRGGAQRQQAARLVCRKRAESGRKVNTETSRLTEIRRDVLYFTG